MAQRTIGFAVMYRWRVAPDKEEAFVAAWRRITELIKECRGGLGSRLHRAADVHRVWPVAERGSMACLGRAWEDRGAR